MNANMTDAMLRYGIGLNPWFFERMEGKPKFPPHNLYRIGDDRYRLTLAVAGYLQDDLKITLHGELLSIAGAKRGWAELPPSAEHKQIHGSVPHQKADDAVDESEVKTLLYQGIAFRNFTVEFLIGQHVRIDSVTLKNGLLDIDLVREIPETEKPRVIPISTAE